MRLRWPAVYNPTGEDGGNSALAPSYREGEHCGHHNDEQDGHHVPPDCWSCALPEGGMEIEFHISYLLALAVATMAVLLVAVCPRVSAGEAQESLGRERCTGGEDFKHVIS